MQVVQRVEALRVARAAFGGSVGLVPTMGALHAGHMALVEAATDENDATIATIFVNPTQFGPEEDLASYPRTLERDLAMLREAGVNLVFTPTPDVMYPTGFQTKITVREAAMPLEGAGRPGHFTGVATVVAKLFNLTGPDRAYFGQKDAQQVVVLRQMARDLNFPLEICPVPTVREADGLALSSRNNYLTPTEREAATVLRRALDAASDAYENGERDGDALRGVMRRVASANVLTDMRYVSVADAGTLAELAGNAPGEQVLLASLAVQIGKPRLLDNMLLPAHLNTREGLGESLGVS